jgi:hypothetical protein
LRSIAGSRWTVSNFGFIRENILINSQHLIIGSNLALTAQCLPQWSPFLHNDSPLTFITDSARFARITANTEIIRMLPKPYRKLPAPIFLKGLRSLNVALGQLGAYPRGYILPETARIDKVCSDFGQVKSVGSEANVYRIHAQDCEMTTVQQMIAQSGLLS